MVIPGFTAGNSLVKSTRLYRHPRATQAVSRMAGVLPQQAASGVYLGTHCLPDNTISEVYIDIDRNGQMVGQPHFVQVGKCNFVPPR
jgi:hypothetical protein